MKMPVYGMITKMLQFKDIHTAKAANSNPAGRAEVLFDACACTFYTRDGNTNASASFLFMPAKNGLQ